jgi:hypothetical protein
MKSSNYHDTREGWLRAATNELRSYFAGCGYPLPDKIRFAIGFQGLRRHHRPDLAEIDVAGREQLEQLGRIDRGLLWLEPEIGGDKGCDRRLLAPFVEQRLEPRDRQVVFPIFPAPAAAVDDLGDQLVPIGEFGLRD